VAFPDPALIAGESYDLIVADLWIAICTGVAWDHLPKLMRLCYDTLITNYSAAMIQDLQVAPDDLDGLTRAVAERTGVRVDFIEVLVVDRPATLGGDEATMIGRERAHVGAPRCGRSR
jgi:hypothetical protein